MKTVLIATDFSNASRNASYYGIALAKETDANVYLFNAYKVPTPSAGLNLSVSRYDVMMQTDKRLLEEANMLDPGNKEMEIICDEGPPEETIIKIANEKKVDFIIAGMKGSGKNFKKIFGSTATSLSKKTNIPVIIVPEDAIYKSPGTIVFASDTPVTDHEIPEQLTSIIRLFKSKLYVVKVIGNNNQEFFVVPESAQKKETTDRDIEASFQYPKDADIRHTLSDFIDRHQADMIVMMPHKHEWIERLFKKSETKDMIFHTKIPLLILPENHNKIPEFLKMEASEMQLNT